MIIREADNVWAYTDHPEVKDLLKYRAPGYQFIESFKKGYWDGWTSLIKVAGAGRPSYRFPAGLVPYVAQQPWFKGKQIADVRGPGPLKYFLSGNQVVSLIPEQEAIVQLALQEKQGILQAPTGVGKGRIMGEIIRRLGVRTLVVCDKKDLLEQLHKEIGECIPTQHIGRVGGGHYDERTITVATVQTLTSNRSMDVSFFKKFDCVIVDEVHHAPSNSMKAVLQLCNAYYRFGLSATAFKSDKDRGTFLEVQAFIGPMLGMVTASQAITAGRIVGADIFMVTGISPVVNAQNYREEYEQLVVLSLERNTAILTIANMLEGPTVILVDRVEHGKLFETALNVPFIHGGVSSRERKTAYDRFKLGLVPVLVIGKLGNEALDLPNIQNLIIASGGKSPHVTIQKVGRSLRASPGKTRATVFDFWDYGKYLNSHSKRRLTTYRNEPAYTVNLISKEELGL